MSEAIPMPPRKWFQRVVLPTAVLAAVAILLIMTSWSSLSPSPVVRATNVVVREIETSEPIPAADEETDGPSAVQALGWVEADPFSVYAGALTEGVVEEILVLEGDRVVRNQPVAQLVADEAELSLAQAEANLEHLEADVVRAEGKLAQLPVRIASAEADQRALADEVRRKSTLVESGAVAEGPVARLREQLKAAEADVDHLRLEEQILRNEIRDTHAKRDAGRAQRDAEALRLSRMTVRSPIDGVVMERLTSPGSVIQFGNGEHGTHVVHLYNPRKLQVRADIPLSQAAQVAVGHPAEIIVDILPGTVFRGEVSRFVHRADLQKNTIEAKVRIIDPSPLLKPEMLARVKITDPPVAPTADGMRRVPRVFIPIDAIDDAGRVLIARPRDDGRSTATQVQVRTGPNREDAWVEVIAGIRPGDRIILDDVPDGQIVRLEVE